MAHGGDDRDGARRDGADDALVAEREEILEAAAAAREDHDVDALGGRKPRERADNGAGAAGPCTRVSAMTSRTAG